MRALDAIDHLIALARKAERAQFNAPSCDCGVRSSPRKTPCEHDALRGHVRQAEEALADFASAFHDAISAVDRERDKRGLDAVHVPDPVE